MEGFERTPSFSLARPFPSRPERFSRETQNSWRPPPDAVGDDNRHGTECDPQVVAAETQADEAGDESFASEASTQVGDLDGATVTGADQSNENLNTIKGFEKPRRRDSRPVHDEVPEEAQQDSPANFWARFRSKIRRPLAEWLGTTLFIFIGICGNLSVVTSKYGTGGMQSMYWCWGFSVMLAVYIAGGASGAFLNPALTIMLSIFRGFPARRIPSYIIAQLTGAFTGALLAFALYHDDIMHLDGGLIPSSTGTAFYTEPKDWIQPSTAFFCELFGTAFISCSILALGDANNSPPGAGMHAFIIGLLTTTVTMALGFSTGGCFNPARDFGPRLATVVVGYPSDLFSSHGHWWLWGPWCATIAGALFGALVYDLCIFKGHESPVNYPCGQWKNAALDTKPTRPHSQQQYQRRSVLASVRNSRGPPPMDIPRTLEAGEYPQHSHEIIEMYFEPAFPPCTHKSV